MIEEPLGTRGPYHLYRVRHLYLDREYTVYSPTDQSGGSSMIELTQQFREAYGDELELDVDRDGIFLVVAPKQE